MDLNATALFVAAVQAGSLSAAAARLEIPLPTLSRRIRQLEQELAVQLMERSVRGIQPTDAGMRLYEHANRGVEMLEEAEKAVRSDQAQIKGRLRLSIPPAMEPWWDLLRNFQARYRDIRLAIYATERRIDLIADGVDVALRIGAIADESMVAKPLASYRHVLVASPKLIRRLGNPTSIDDLHRFPCAAWASGPGARGEWRLGERAFEPAAVIAANDYQQLRRCALAGDALTELPPFLARRDLASGKLVAVLAHFPLPEQAIQLLYPAHRHPSSLIRAYIEFCQQHAARFIAGDSTIEPPPAG